MIQRLRQAQKEWLTVKDYKRNAIEPVYQYNLQWREENPGKYPYNDNIKEYIKEKESIPAELLEQLSMEVYLSQGQISRGEKDAYKQKMLAAGYLELNKEAVGKAITENKKLAVVAQATNDWMTMKIDKTYKPFVFNRGTDKESYGLMNPRARSRGYSLYQFENAFCKLTN